MKTQDQIQEYVDALIRQGVKAYSAAPPVYRVLWRMGISITPPYSQALIINFLFFALALFFIVSIILTIFTFLFWGFTNWSRILPILTKPTFYPGILGGGLIFGLIMASYVKYRGRNVKVPKW